MAASQSEDADQLWVLSDDAFPFQRGLSESQVSFWNPRLNISSYNLSYNE